jgi:predicted N-acetyltransferase YhbS
VQIRDATADDLGMIAGLDVDAFGTAEGEDIVRLTGDLADDASAQPLLSLVATSGGKIVGHVMFSRARIDGVAQQVSASLLAPLAVHPDVQSRGIGGRLVAEGLGRLRRAGVDLVFVLGHPGYYPRFGFIEAGANGFTAPYLIAPENAAAWMVRALRPGVLGAVRGRVVCADALDDLKYWCD